MIEDTITVKSTKMIIGKGVKPGNHGNDGFVWIVTAEALKKIKAKKIKFQLV